MHLPDSVYFPPIQQKCGHLNVFQVNNLTISQDKKLTLKIQSEMTTHNSCSKNRNSVHAEFNLNLK